MPNNMITTTTTTIGMVSSSIPERIQTSIRGSTRSITSARLCCLATASITIGLRIRGLLQALASLGRKSSSGREWFIRGDFTILLLGFETATAMGIMCR